MKDEDKTKEELIEELQRLRSLLKEMENEKAERAAAGEGEKVRNDRKRLETVINTSRDIIFLKGKDFRYLIANTAHEELFNVKIKDIIGKTDFDFMPEEVAAECRKSDEDALKSDEPVDREEYAMGRFFHVIKQRIVDVEGNIEGIVAVIRDITERKKMEEELLKSQKFESLGILAGGIAHDFNNLLTAILGNIYLAKLSLSPQNKIFEMLTESEKASLRAKDLAKQLLTFSSRGEPVKKTISIGESIKDWCAFALRGSAVRHECVIPEDLWPVEVEKGQMHQVINNLLINALQAMTKGGVIRVQAENITVGTKDIPPLKEGRYVKISIEDQGVGIPEEHLQRIFDPYFTTKENGSGLGLAIAYSIIKKYAGHIRVESKVGMGTTFYVYLPASDREIAMDSPAEKGPHSGKGRILFMDDEEMIRNFAGNVLRHFGYETEFAIDGIEAIGLYKRAREAGQPFDAVIMDLTIRGGMGAKEVIKELLKIDPQAKVIVSSGYPKDPVMERYGEYGFKGILVKPYTHKGLCEAVQRVIEET